MYPHQKLTVTTLEEDFKSVGLDPDAAMGTIDRQHALVERRIGIPSQPNVPGGEPPLVGIPDPTSPGRPASLHEDFEPSHEPSRAHAPADLDEDQADRVRRAFEMMEAVGEYEPLVDLSDIEAANREEGLKMVRKKIKTAAEKLAGKLKYKANRAMEKIRSMKFRRTNKRQIAKRRKLKKKKFGDRLKGMGSKFRAVFAGVEDDIFSGELAQLREDLNTSLSGQPHTGASDEYHGPYEEAAYNCGLLALYIGEHMEALGDEQSAETLYQLSDSAAELSEALEGVMDEDDLTEDHEAELRGVIDGCVKALRVYEGLGSPTLGECFAYAEGNLQG